MAGRMKISALVITLFFAFGVWCTSFAATNLPTLAAQRSDWQGDCAKARLVSNNILTSSRSDGLAKGAQLFTAGFPLRLPGEGFSQKQAVVSAPQIVSAKKVPIHLINSVLTI